MSSRALRSLFIIAAACAVAWVIGGAYLATR